MNPLYKMFKEIGNEVRDQQRSSINRLTDRDVEQIIDAAIIKYNDGVKKGFTKPERKTV